MKSHRYSLDFMCVVICLSLAMVILIPLSPASADECYKYITFKNEGIYIVEGEVTYQFGGYRFDKKTGHFSRGQEKKVAIPCAATSVIPSAKVVQAVGGVPILRPTLKFFRAEDRCFLLKGTSENPDYQSCDPPGTPPIVDVVNCWKHITIKNDGAYVAEAILYYTPQSEHVEFWGDTKISSGSFAQGKVKQLSVPCYADSRLYVSRSGVIGDTKLIHNRALPRGQDYCFILKGTHPSPRYEVCAIAGEQIHTITIRNYGAYATELSVAYDHGGTRMNPKAVIHAQKRGAINVPQQATNVHITAKAIAGEKILDVTIPTARSLCYEVRGGTFTTRWAYCPP